MMGLAKREQANAAMLVARPRGGRVEADPVIDVRRQLTDVAMKRLSFAKTRR